MLFPRFRRSAALTAIAWLAWNPASAAAQTLDSLVAEGLRANLGLSQERVALGRARAGLAAAQALRLPALEFQARYTERSGAVTDIGRLLNPALGALNQLLGAPTFPTDVALALPFKQETGVRLSQPLFSPAIRAAGDAARADRDRQAASLAGAARRVAAEIQVAYLDYLKAVRVTELYDSTRLLVEETVRANEALLANGTATPDQVLRAQADREAVVQQRAEAGRLAAAARRRVNVLLDRPVDGPLAVFPDSALGLRLAGTADEAVHSALARREEFAQVAAGVRAARAQARAAGASRLPTVAAAVDYGFQGDRYQLTADRDHLLGSVVVQWTVFDGGRSGARRREASYDVERYELQAAEARRLIELEVRTAHDAARVAGDAIGTAGARSEVARRAYQLVARRYREGAASLLEVLDARTTRTAADLNLILTTYDFYQRCAELDRAAALRPAPGPLSGDPS